MLIAKYVSPSQNSRQLEASIQQPSLGFKATWLHICDLDPEHVLIIVDISKLENPGMPDKTICIIFGVTPGTENP